ncbi:TetR family transcriptional regulator [Spirochaetia bacterium]|nr:TetR family transcriptional regulator [Spirochaetia bacterium]
MEPKKRGMTRDTVLAAAVKIVEKQGFAQLTIQELASSLQVKPASLYNHISGIDEARLRLARYALEKMEAGLRDTAVGYSREEALKKIAFAYRHFALKHPELYKAFINSANIEDRKIGEAKQSVVRVFHQVLEPYSLDDGAKVHFTRCFRSSLHGFVSLETAGFFKNSVDSNTSFEMLVENNLALLNDLVNGSLV